MMNKSVVVKDMTIIKFSGKQERLSKAATHHPASGKSDGSFHHQAWNSFYSGNFVEDDEKGKNGAAFIKNIGAGNLCLETQFFPNSLKHTHFPSPILKAGEEYHHTTIFKVFQQIKRALGGYQVKLNRKGLLLILTLGLLVSFSKSHSSTCSNVVHR